MNLIKYNGLLLCFLLFCGFAQAIAPQQRKPSVTEEKHTDSADKAASLDHELCEQPDKLSNLLYSDVGIDHSLLTLSLGYGRYFDIETIKRRLLLFADYGMPLANFDIRNFRLRVGLGASAFDYKTFRIPVRLSFNVVGAHNKIFQSVGLGSELGIAPGYYGSLFEIAPEFYWDQKWGTHIRHSNWYRQHFYENAKNGWYGMTSSSIRAGLHLAWNVNERFLIGLKGGYQRHGQYNVLIPPVYGMLHTEFRL